MGDCFLRRVVFGDVAKASAQAADGWEYEKVASLPGPELVHTGDAVYSPDGEVLYVASRNGWISWLRERADGGFEPVGSVRAPRAGGEMLVSPDGRHLYAGHDPADLASGLDVFEIDPVDGALTEIGGTGGARTRGGASIVATPDGKTLFMAAGDWYSPELTSASRDVTTGALTVKAQGGQKDIEDLAVSPDGRQVYVLHADMRLSIHPIEDDGELGYPEYTGQIATPVQNGGSIAISPDGRSVYVGAPEKAYGSSPRPAQLIVLARDPLTGSLNEVQRLTDDSDGVDRLAGVAEMTFSKDGRSLLVAAPGDQAWNDFSIDATGALTPAAVHGQVGGVFGRISESDIAVSSDTGTVAIPAGPGLVSYREGPSGFELADAAATGSIAGVVGLTMSADGRFAWAATGRRITTYSVDAVSGSVQAIDHLEMVDQIQDGPANEFFAPPDGHHLYLFSEKGLVLFDVAGDGSLTRVGLTGPDDVDDNQHVTHAPFTADGSMMLARLDRDGQKLGVFDRDVATGEITLRQGLDLVTESLALSPDGRFAYAMTPDGLAVLERGPGGDYGEPSFVDGIDSPFVLSRDGHDLYTAEASPANGDERYSLDLVQYRVDEASGIPQRAGVTPLAHPAPPLRGDVSLDDRTLILASDNHTPGSGNTLALARDPNSGEVHQFDADLADGDEAVVDVALTPDAGLMLTARRSGTLQVHRLEPGTPPRTIIHDPGATYADPRPSLYFELDQGYARSSDCRVDGGLPEPCSAVRWHTPDHPLSDGMHTFAVRSVDLAGNAEEDWATAPFSVDTTPPEITIVSAPEDGSTIRERSASVRFAVSADAEKVDCYFDKWHRFCADGTFEQEGLSYGPHKIRIEAWDEHANQRVVEIRFNVESDYPNTRITSGLRNGQTTMAGRPTFTFEADEPATGFECRFDRDAFDECSGTGEHTPQHELTGGGESHAFEVRAIAPNGNYESEPARAEFRVDRDVAQAKITSGPSGPDPIEATEAIFEFTVTQPYGGIECGLDDGPMEPCDEGRYVATGLSDGEHVFSVRGVDVAGIRQEPSKSRQFDVDTVPIETTITAAPRPYTNDVEPTLEFTASETGATFRCRLDSEPWEDCASPWRPGALGDGRHYATIEATDPYGHSDKTPATSSFLVDTVAPETEIAYPSEPGTVIRGWPYLKIETEGGFFGKAVCSIDGARWKQCGSSWAPGPLPDGRHDFVAAGIDKAGNVDPTPARTWIEIDNTPAVVQFTAGPDRRTETRRRRVTGKFEFEANEAGVAYECKARRGAAWRPCSSPFKARYGTGRRGKRSHTMKLRATDPVGNTSIERYWFTVRRVDRHGDPIRRR